MHGDDLPSAPVTAGTLDTPDAPGAVDAVVFFWRPGCGFCSSLRRALESEGVPLVEVDIWEDPRAAEAVRSITGGNETVPTVVVGSAALVNPTPRQVLAALAAEAPHLLERR